MKIVKFSLFLISSILIFACGGAVEEESSTEIFNELADEEGFAEMHDEPLKLNVDALGEMVDVSIANGEDAITYSVKSEGSHKYLLVFHEWWGLNNHIIAEADRLFEMLGDVTVIAVDLYDGEVATDRARATELMQGTDEVRCANIITAVYNELPKNASIGTIGWCFGGGWSLKAALAGGDKTNACVMYYGMPVEAVEELKGLNSDVLFIFAEKDQWINQAVADKFKVNMKTAGKELTILPFDEDHAFANPSSQKYSEKSAQKANAAAIEYFREKLK